ncbi:hypothetical protein [Herbaspirillum sp. CF444]|uniref:hypothetical protein n=1 Tax=Herbaspirillum sp. CF444 TaxID=1144319 RepID=UPI0012F7543F|nr:hypothetical protein [Herbaspirillum sp. CF444]
MRLGGGTHAQRGADAVNRKPSNSVSTLAVPRKAVTVAVDGKLSSRAKRSIFLKVGKSANRVQSINRQALRFQLKVLPDFILIIQAHLFNTQVRYPIATAVQTGLAQG